VATTEQKIKNYEQGAADCRAMQLRMQAEGKTETARAHGEAVDANLDAINQLKGQR
jgi:hypothetical protein